MVPELYWLPGCTSCLRMKEFVESTGVAFESINVVADPARGKRLADLGGSAPAAVVDGRWAHGGDLAAVAALIGVDYQPREPLAPVELCDRYHAIVSSLCCSIEQATPAALVHGREDRSRTLADIAHHAASVMRVFINTYDPETYADCDHDMDPEARVPPRLASVDGLVGYARSTVELLDGWWERDGFDDPLDRVVSTYWGHQTLHAAFEREVWHTAQHTRQVEALLREVGIEPLAPVGPAELDGLPLPERVFA